MSGNLGSNPFLALFGSLDEAQTFTQQQLQNLVPFGNTKEGLPEADSVVCDPEDSTISVQAKECLEVNRLVEDVFHLTVNNHVRNDANGVINKVVFLEELAAAVAPQDWIDIETLEQALFERLLLEDPGEHLVGRNVHDGESFSRTDTHATEKEAMPYLFECVRRLHNIEAGVEGSDRKKPVFQMLNLVFRSAVSALKQPELFEPQELDAQILRLIADDSISRAYLDVFIDGLVQQFVVEDGEVNAIDTLLLAFTPMLDTVHAEFAEANIFTIKCFCFNVLDIFACRSHLGSVLIVHSTPEDPRLGWSYADTLLGSVLCLTCLPTTPDGPFEFFEKAVLQAVGITEGNIWTATEAVTENLYKVFHALLKCSNDVRHQTLCWLADCLHANEGRGKLWNSSSFNLGAFGCVSDGFMLNLGCVLLRLCQPFCADPTEPKLLLVDPTYCAVEVTGDAEMRARGVHMKKLASETCLIPAAEGTPRPTSETYGFVSECFYLAHKALDIGFRVTFEHVMKSKQDLARIQRAYIDAESRASGNSDVLQPLIERMQVDKQR
jgi:ubiquitin conjugation factor E4 A